MKLHTVSNLDNAGTILRKRGLEPNGRVQRFFTGECARRMDKYIPFQQGILKDTRIIDPDRITYITPYAKFQYYGKVMVGIKSGSPWAEKGERKVVTARDLKHHGAPTRGPFWDKRMWEAQKTTILNSVAKMAGGTVE